MKKITVEPQKSQAVCLAGFAKPDLRDGSALVKVVAFALLIGVVALPGAFLAKAFVERMPVHLSLIHI